MRAMWLNKAILSPPSLEKKPPNRTTDAVVHRGEPHSYPCRAPLGMLPRAFCNCCLGFPASMVSKWSSSAATASTQNGAKSHETICTLIQRMVGSMLEPLRDGQNNTIECCAM